MVVVQESLDFIRWERIQICKLFIRVGAARQEADHIVAAGQNLHDAAVERLETVTGGGDSFCKFSKFEKTVSALVAAKAAGARRADTRTCLTNIVEAIVVLSLVYLECNLLPYALIRPQSISCPTHDRGGDNHQLRGYEKGNTVARQ